MGANEAFTAGEERGVFLERVSGVIREFVVDNFMFGEGDGLEEGTSFQDGGIVDSTGILELVDFLETQFSITISDEELVPENLDSVQKVTSFLSRKCLTDAQS